METRNFFATTAKGMEPLLGAELEKLGALDVQVTRAGAAFSGDLKTAYRACLGSRVANRILLPLKTFPAPTPEKLYGGVKSIRWSDHMTPDETLAVDFASFNSAITHTLFGALKVKDAIVDQMRSVQGRRPSVKTDQPDVQINVYVLKDIATVSIDLSGESLHLRGYRADGVFAPLKENLAAAILALAGWPEAAARGEAFLDPMCGSGTLPIEAALIAAKIAPGASRKYFGFLKWKPHQPAAWEEVKKEAAAGEVRSPKLLPKIVGYDSDPRAVAAAIAGVERAGLRGIVHIEKRDIFTSGAPARDAESAPAGDLSTRAQAHDADPIAPAGIFVVNPPYGERLGETEELKPLYSGIGDAMKQRFKGWKGHVFTGNPDLAKVIGLRAARRHVLYNGAIECRLLAYDLY